MATPGEGECAIANLSADTACETLGVFTAPNGSSAKTLEAMRDNAGEWVERATGANLHRRQVWFMLDKQFWPRVAYDLCASTATWAQLEDCLQKKYYKLLPIGGIVSSAPTGMRQLDRGFFGAGCPHPGVECLISQSNKLVMHYGCRSGLGLKIQASLELFMIELRLLHQPFLTDYEKYGHLVTH